MPDQGAVEVEPQPASSSFGPEQTLGEVELLELFELLELLELGPLGGVAGLGGVVGLGLVEPLDPLLACAMLSVVTAGTA